MRGVQFRNEFWNEEPESPHTTLCIVGPGYVGYPLACAFAEHIRTIGYRRKPAAVDELNRGHINATFIVSPCEPPLNREDGGACGEGQMGVGETA